MDDENDKLFELHPELKSRLPDKLTSEPLNVTDSVLLSPSIRDEITREIAEFAHNAHSNKEIYQLYKRVSRLGKIYSKTSDKAEVKNESKAYKTTDTQLLSSFGQVDDKLISLICNQCFANPESIYDIFQESLDSLNKIPVLGLTSQSVSASSSHLGYARTVDRSALKLLTLAPSDAKTTPLLSNVVLESSLVRGSLTSALCSVKALLACDDAEILTSTVNKLQQYPLPYRLITKYEGRLANLLATLRKKEGEKPNEPITGPYTTGSELQEQRPADRKTYSNVWTSALILAELERLSANHAATDDELEFITGKRERVNMSSNSGPKSYSTHSSMNSNGSHYGIAFEIHVKDLDMVINNFEANMRGNNCTLRIWHREGKLDKPIQQSSSGWTKVFENTSHNLLGSAPYKCADLDLNIKCEANSVHSFYFHRSNSSGMQYGSSLTQPIGVGPDSKDLILRAGRYTSSSTPFSSVSSYYQFQGRVLYSLVEELVPETPEPSSPAPLQFECNKQTFEYLSGILDQVLPVFKEARDAVDEQTDLCYVNIIRSTAKILNVNIYQYSLLKKKFQLSPELLSSIRVHLESLQSLVAPAHTELNLDSVCRLINRSASEAFASAISLFYSTPIGRWRYTLNSAMIADVEVATPFKELLAGLVADDVDTQGLYPQVIAEMDRLFEAISKTPAKTNLVSIVFSLADILFNEVYQKLAKQQAQLEVKNEEDEENKVEDIVVPKPIYDLLLYFNQKLLDASVVSCESTLRDLLKTCGTDEKQSSDFKQKNNDLYKSFVKTIPGCGHFVRYLHALYLVSSPDRLEVSQTVLPKLLALLQSLISIQQYKIAQFKPLAHTIKDVVTTGAQLLFCQLRGKTVIS